MPLIQGTPLKKGHARDPAFAKLNYVYHITFYLINGIVSSDIFYLSSACNKHRIRVFNIATKRIHCNSVSTILSQCDESY